MYQTETVTSCLKNNLLDTIIRSKFGTLVPNRIFVGGLPANTSEDELRAFFAQFGEVKDVKVIIDRLGLSKGTYGFVTFESQEVAEKIISNESDTLVFQERKLNISFAIKKNQTAPRPELSTAALLFGSQPPSMPLSYQPGLSSLPFSQITAPLNNNTIPSLAAQNLLSAQNLTRNLNPVNSSTSPSALNPIDSYLTAASLLMPNAYLQNGINPTLTAHQLNALQLAQQTMTAQVQQHLQAVQPITQNSNTLNGIQSANPQLNGLFQSGLNSPQPLTSIPNLMMHATGQNSPDEMIYSNSTCQQNQGLLTTVGNPAQQKPGDCNMVVLPSPAIRPSRMYYNSEPLTSAPIQSPDLSVGNISSPSGEPLSISVGTDFVPRSSNGPQIGLKPAPINIGQNFAAFLGV